MRHEKENGHRATDDGRTADAAQPDTADPGGPASADEPDFNGVIVVLLTERIPRGRSGNLADLARVLQGRNRCVELVESSFDDRAERSAGPEALAVASVMADDVRGALATLSPHRRSLMVALFADDRGPYADIARKLGIPIGSIGPTRARTLAELRSVLEQRAGGAVTTVLPARATIR